MGSAPEAMLAYGYDLGGDNVPGGWNLKDPNKISSMVDKNGRLNIEAIQDSLLTKILGFVLQPMSNNHAQNKLYRDSLLDARKRLGLQVTRYGSFDYPGYILSTKVYRSPDWGSVVVPHIDEANFFQISDYKLATAILLLGIEPTQEGPAWNLATFYG